MTKLILKNYALIIFFLSCTKFSFYSTDSRLAAAHIINKFVSLFYFIMKKSML